MKMIKRIALTMGEPAGIGPELLVKIAQLEFDAQIVVLADSVVIQQAAKQLNLSLKLVPIDWKAPARPHQPGQLLIEPFQLPSPVVTGQLSSDNALATLKMLTRAGELALSKQVDAIVTAPVHKATLNQVEASFLGHTEFFAQQAGIDKVVMLLATNQLRIALATTHLPLNQVSAAIDADLIEQTVSVIQQSFHQLNLARPKIAVCGLNPHAGENGVLGSEEIDTIEPAIQTARESGIDVHGPFPADSLFTPQNRANYDVFLAMYHDQGLPVVKAIGFGECANITLGLPYIRTSVDHGTALDIADQFCASESSLAFAIDYALKLANGKLPS